MAKKLDQLDAAKAGVTQAVLTQAFDTLPMLEEEHTEWEGKLETALTDKRKARTALDDATDKVREILSTRDAVTEEWARASWIVRNADPDQPAPPLGNQPPGIKTLRKG
jgi:hypothetical protein